MSQERKGKAPVKVKMKATVYGQDASESGAALPQRRYFAGEEYTVGHSLAKTFFDMGVAVPAGGKAPAQAAEVSVKEGAPENKAETPTENKDAAPEPKGKKGRK